MGTTTNDNDQSSVSDVTMPAIPEMSRNYPPQPQAKPVITQEVSLITTPTIDEMFSAFIMGGNQAAQHRAPMGARHARRQNFLRRVLGRKI